MVHQAVSSAEWMVHSYLNVASYHSGLELSHRKLCFVLITHPVDH